MSEGRGCRESFRQQKDLIHCFALCELFNCAPFVKQARHGPNDVFANGFEQEKSRLGHAGIFRPNRHYERARFLDDASWPPVGVRLAVVHRRFRIEMTAHRLDVFLPGVVVQDEIAESRMTFKGETKQILGLPLMPVRSMHKFDNAGKNCLVEWRVHQYMNPASLAVTIKAVTQFPLACPFLDHQARETKLPCQEKPAAQFRKRGPVAAYFTR